MAKTKKKNRIYRLRIDLDDVDPPIWRVIELDEDMPIDFTADAIRCAFGWSFTHGYELKIKKRLYGTFNDWIRHDPEQIYQEECRKLDKLNLSPKEHGKKLDELLASVFPTVDEQEEDDEDIIPALNELVKRVNTKFKFLFDFGDCWEHTVRLEKISQKNEKIKYPLCVDGIGANPIEDCGGAWRMNEIMKSTKQPKPPAEPVEDEFMDASEYILQWNYDDFSVEAANKAFRKMFK